MPRAARSAPSPIPASEQRVLGVDLGLPLAKSLSAIHSRSAARITWHSHPMFEALFLLEGATAYEFAGGQSVELPGGYFLVVPPGLKHRGQADVRRPARLCGMVFDPRGPRAATNTCLTRRDLDWLAQRCEEHAGQARPMGSELRRLAAALARQIAGHDRAAPGAAAALRLTACATLVEAARQLDAVQAAAPDQVVRAAVACMEARYGEELPMKAVAAAGGCSRSRLFQLFKQATGMTPSDYLQRLRIERATTLLSGTNRAVTDIALSCGFATSQYFSNVFRKYAGTTPSAYRAACGAKP